MADINNSDATAPLRRVIGRHLVCHAPHAKLLLAACLLGSPNSNSNHAQQQQHVVPDITSAVTMRISVVAAGSGNPMIRSLAIDGETTVSALKVEIRALATTPPPADRDFRLCLGHGGTALQGGDGSLVAQGVRPGAVLVVIVDHLTQDQVLQRLYEDCNGRKWRKSAGWCGPAPSSLANWHGVTATRDGLHVVKLSLECNSLEGPIPTQIGQLGQLTCLWLNNNQLTGPIPTQIGQLGRLDLLRVDNNQLTDTAGFKRFMKQKVPGATVYI